MNIYVVEDDIFHLEDLKISLEELGYSCIGSSDDPFEAQKQIELLKPDLVIIDICLRGRESGIELGESIQKMYNIPVFFTTSQMDKNTMIRAAEIDPVAYLTKPVSKEDLQAAIVLSANRKETISKPSLDSDKIFIKHGNKLIKVNLDSILYAHVDSKNYCSIITVEGKKFSVRYSIQKLHKQLGRPNFVQTHRSYIVNLEKITAFHESDHTIEIGSHHIPIGRTFKERGIIPKSCV